MAITLHLLSADGLTARCAANLALIISILADWDECDPDSAFSPTQYPAIAKLAELVIALPATTLSAATVAAAERACAALATQTVWKTSSRRQTSKPST